MLKSLYALQQLEVAEEAIHTERMNSREYKELRRIKAAFEAKKQQYLRLQNDIAALSDELAAYPAQLAEQQRKIAAEQSAIYDGSVSSPKALAAREAQLAALNEGLGLLETAQRAKQLELEQKQSASGSLKEEMTEQYEVFRRVKEAYQSAQAQRDARLAELAEKKAALLAEIDEDSLAWFESLRARFKGTPVAMLDAQHVCSGCHTIVTPIAYKRALLGQQTHCEKCGRILFVSEVGA